MSEKKKVLVCEFLHETNTFNPILTTLDSFQCLEGEGGCRFVRSISGSAHGMIDAIEENGGIVVPGIFLQNIAGGRISDDVLAHMLERIRWHITNSGNLDAICLSLHGATCTESEDDACGALLTFVRELVGEDLPIVASFDMHANITPQILQSTDVICGFQTYPHEDIYDTGKRAGELCMHHLSRKRVVTAATIIPMMVPPVGYSTMEEPFRDVIAFGKDMVSQGRLLDFTIFNVQPWLDIPVIGSAVVAAAEDENVAKACVDQLAKMFYDYRDGYWPELYTIDDVIDMAETRKKEKPVVLVDSADSPNGGAVGDSVAVAMRLMERGSKLISGMFVKDESVVEEAFAVGVGNEGEFTLGAKYTPYMPGPMHGTGVVRSLHDGEAVKEGPIGRGTPFSVGRAAVLSFGTMYVLVCEDPRNPGDPQLFRHFGIEPTLCELLVVKANSSFRIAYSKISEQICFADTPGACSADLRSLHWERIPRELYPFDLPENYEIEEAKRWR